MRRGFQEQAAKGLMTLDELEDLLREIDETRETVPVRNWLHSL